MLQRKSVIFRGRVQGVGFRYTARQIADRFDVSGFVQNLHDGTVRLVAEGEAEEIDRFLAAVGQKMGDYIDGSMTSVEPHQGGFPGFAIRPTGEAGD